MAAGKAIVASDVGDVKKMLKDGLLGFVTTPET
jgi:glycosyltransferase involved in cell wall biosynthesis